LYDINQQYRGSSSIQRQQQQHQSTANYPRQLLGSYKALMHLLNFNRGSPAVDAATYTVSSASVAIIAAVAVAAAAAAATAAAAADAIPCLHILPKLADSLA
jgi:hypothetical protein